MKKSKLFTRTEAASLEQKLLRIGVCENCAIGVALDAEAGYEAPRGWRACAPCLEVIKQHFMPKH
jgi:hypothetical protein